MAHAVALGLDLCEVDAEIGGTGAHSRRGKSVSGGVSGGLSRYGGRRTRLRRRDRFLDFARNEGRGRVPLRRSRRFGHALGTGIFRAHLLGDILRQFGAGGGIACRRFAFGRVGLDHHQR